MSETKWTPGNFHTVGDGIRRLVCDERGRILAVRHRVQKEENEALMTLFSAAPELYEALSWLAYPGVSEDRPSDAELLGMARAALAKARGEQP